MCSAAQVPASIQYNVMDAKFVCHRSVASVKQCGMCGICFQATVLGTSSKCIIRDDSVSVMTSCRPLTEDMHIF